MSSMPMSTYGNQNHTSQLNAQNGNIGGASVINQLLNN